MNLAESFANYLETLGMGTLGQDLWIGVAPHSMIAVDNLCWIIESGGSPLITADTGEMIKNYQIQVYYRSRDYKTVKDKMFLLEEQLNCDGCTQLEGFETIDIEATSFPIDLDIDVEDRKVGMLQANLRTYKEC